MIDYVPLLLTNMVSGLIVLALFLWRGLGRAEAGHWAPAFGSAGLVATVAGSAMSFTWPIPRPFSEIYGETSVLLGVLFLGTAWALARGWSLVPLGIYASFAGIVAIVIGIRFIDLSLTPRAFLPGTGFILTGLGGVCAGVVLYRQDVKVFRLAGTLVLLAAAGIWAFTACTAYWVHMKVPPTAKPPVSWIHPSALPEPLAAFGRRYV